MNVETLFHTIGIDLSKFNSNLRNNKDINELVAILKLKLGIGSIGHIEIIQNLNKINETDDVEIFEDEGYTKFTERNASFYL